jgi:prophage regulatory protein
MRDESMHRRAPSRKPRTSRLETFETLPATRSARLDAVPLRFIRFAAVRDRTGLSRSTIWRLERQGVFPKHRRISPNAVAWLEQEVNEWVLGRPKAG